MEKDIKILEELLNAKISFTIRPTDYGYTAIESLINKYKEQERDIRASHILLAKYSQKNEEQEKIIELMKEYIFKEYISPEICSKHTAEDCYADIYDENACRECIIDYFKKKAGENND